MQCISMQFFHKPFYLQYIHCLYRVQAQVLQKKEEKTNTLPNKRYYFVHIIQDNPKDYYEKRLWF